MIPVRHVIGLSFLLAAVSGASKEPDIEGSWLTSDGDGLITITRIDAGLSGIVAGSKSNDPTRSRIDSKNPDERLRDRPLIGLQLFSGFRYNGRNRWTRGTIYDPKTGKTYRCTITQIDRDTLKVRGYVGIPLLGRSVYWRRNTP